MGSSFGEGFAFSRSPVVARSLLGCDFAFDEESTVEVEAASFVFEADTESPEADAFSRAEVGLWAESGVEESFFVESAEGEADDAAFFDERKVDMGLLSEVCPTIHSLRSPSTVGRCGVAPGQPVVPELFTPGCRRLGGGVVLDLHGNALVRDERFADVGRAG